MKEPVDHILRPVLPWRAAGAGIGAAITECGYDASKVKTLTRPEFFARLKDMGSQRTAILTCMTCADTARRWKAWDDDPREAIEREINWEGRRHRGEHGTRLRDDLIAIAQLIEAHRDEFDAILDANTQRREWLERKAAMEERKAPRREPSGL